MPPTVITRPTPVPAPAWPGGHRIGSFELMAALPSDGASIVYRAWDHALARPVAVEEYFPAGLARREANHDVAPVGPAAAQAFERGRQIFVDEWRTLARCDHPALVRLLQLTEAHGTVYGVRPWYSGRALHDLRQHSATPLAEAPLRALLDDLLGALQAYYTVGWLHGGIDPSKTLYLDDGRALLLAPGAAGRFVRALADRARGGPAGEMEAAGAPADGGDGPPPGPWTDFFALAALARFCITGAAWREPPAGPPEPLAVTIARQFAEPGAPHYRPELLGALDAALSVDITRRPQTVAQFRAWLLQGPPQAGPEAMVARPAAAVWQFPSPGRQTAAPPPAPGPAIAPAGAPAEPEPAEAAPAAPSNLRTPNAVDDAATVQFIRRLLDAIPEPAVPLRKPARPPAPPPDAIAAEPEFRAVRSPRRQSPRRYGAWLIGAGIAVLLFAGLAVDAWQSRPPREREAVVVHPVAPDAAPLLAPAPPAAPIVAMPPPAVVEPDPVPAHASAPESLVPEVVVPPAAVEPPPVPKRERPPAALPTTSPREQCGARTAFSLYRCMQQQCGLARWQGHPQCLRLKATDAVD